MLYVAIGHVSPSSPRECHPEHCALGPWWRLPAVQRVPPQSLRFSILILFAHSELVLTVEYVAAVIFECFCDVIRRQLAGCTLGDLGNASLACVLAQKCMFQCCIAGIPGVCCVTAGPGLTNCVTAIKNAQMAESPVVLLGGAAATVLKGRGALQDIDQMALFKPIVK